MNVKIPCPSCGCQYCEALTNEGIKVRIEVCRCKDGSGEFDISVYNETDEWLLNEKHQCAEDEISHCLTSRFKINLDSMSHECF